MTDQIVQLLAEAGMSDDDDLLEELITMREDATAVRPIPSAELALLLRGRRRSSLGRRGVITALVVLGTLGGAGTAAAASPDVRAAVGHAVQSVVGAIVPGVSPAPDSPVAPRPTPNNAPSPEATAPGHSGASDHPNPTNHPGNGGTHGPNPGNGGSHGANSGNGNGNGGSSDNGSNSGSGNSGKH